MKKVESPWNFDQPPYDERSSCYVSAGTHHGVGYRNPVGKDVAGTKSAVPFGKGQQLRTDQILKKNLDIELEK